MKIKRHRLHDDDGRPLEWRPSPNLGDALEPEYLVIHYTAAGSLEGSVSWLVQKDAKASAHVVIGRDGRIVQLVPFDRVASHVGVSQWEGRNGLNQWSIGIELDNAGKLTRQSEGWRSWFGRRYGS